MHLRQTRFFLSGRSFSTKAVFDRKLKTVQRNIAATLEDREDYEYLHDAVAERVVDRLADITRTFPVAVDVGCRAGHICKSLCDDAWDGEARGGVKSLIQCDVALEMVVAAEKAAMHERVTNAGLKVHSLVADEEHLPFAEESVDLALSSLSLHWVNDLPGALTQIKQSLKPDGVFIGAMLGGETLKELRSSLLLAEQEREGGVGIHISPFAQVADCGNLIQRAGFSLPTVDTDLIQVDYPDAFTLMSHLGKMGENNAAISRRPKVSRETFIAAAAIYQELYGNEDGSVPATFQVLYMIGWKPHASQPAPKKRGSATRSFKDLQVHRG